MGTVLQLITWTTTGLFVGWLVRTAMRSRRDFGLAGDLTPSEYVERSQQHSLEAANLHLSAV